MACNCSANSPKECGRNICCGKCDKKDSCELIAKCKKCAPPKETQSK